MSKSIHYEEMPYGFEYGSATIQRFFSDADKGLVVMELKTPKHDSIQIRVTKTGKVRIVDSRGKSCECWEGNENS